MSILNQLNESQIQAVTTTEGYIRVVAGAGSGKTKALTHRYAYLVEELGVMPANILCVTFTNKAANEMKQRIRHMIGDGDLGKIATFHGFCVQILREDCNVVSYPDRFLILDEEDVHTMLKECFERLGITNREYTIGQAMESIGRRKEEGEYVTLLSDPSTEQLAVKRAEATSKADKVFYEYLHLQRKNYGLDYDDLLIFVMHIFTIEPSVQEKWQKRLQYIMVDEFQDVSNRQYSLVNTLSEYHENLFIVGDPDQTIYSWRGANIEYILNFDTMYPNAITIMMNENYRSLPEVIHTSNALIAKNENRLEKSLIPIRRGKGGSVYFHGKTQKEEASWIVTQMKHLAELGISFSDMVVLYRAHYVSRTVEEELVKQKIPYILYSGTAFYRRKEIKDILCYFRMITSGDDLAFLRVINEPKRGMGKKRIEFLKDYAETHQCSLYNALKDNLDHTLLCQPTVQDFVAMIDYFQGTFHTITITDLLVEVLRKTGYEEHLRTSGEEERLNNLAELKQAIYDYETTAGEETTLTDYLDHIALFTNIDKEEKNQSVKLMTIHTAKGLEFPVVFVCALSEGIFPSVKTDTKEKMEEERRLAYVAFTRAKEQLFLSDSEGIHYDGSFRYPSRFIFNCEKVNLDYVVELPERFVMTAQRIIEESEQKLNVSQRLPIGTQVVHSVFGTGEILEVLEEESCYVVKFERFKTARNLSFTAL